MSTFHLAPEPGMSARERGFADGKNMGRCDDGDYADSYDDYDVRYPDGPDIPGEITVESDRWQYRDGFEDGWRHYMLDDRSEY